MFYQLVRGIVFEFYHTIWFLKFVQSSRFSYKFHVHFPIRIRSHLSTIYVVNNLTIVFMKKQSIFILKAKVSENQFTFTWKIKHIKSNKDVQLFHLRKAHTHKNNGFFISTPIMSISPQETLVTSCIEEII